MSSPWRFPLLFRLARALSFPLAAAAACSKAPKESAGIVVRRDWPAPSTDPGDHCADTGDLRVCWDGAGTPVSADGAPRPEPSLSAMGFRCTGAGKERRCRDRAATAPLFRCQGSRCTQRHPRLPDDGEWECADGAGMAVCRGGEPPAGVAPGARDDGFTCGFRRTHGAVSPERICVDPSPDFPDGTMRGWACHFEPQGGLVRVCEKSSGVHVLTDACDGGHPCVDGARCVSGRCVPRSLDPSCWVDTDCAAGACRFGTCTEVAP